MYSLVVKFDVLPERLAEFDTLVEATIAGIREQEDGTVAYLSSALEGDPYARVFIEVYRDREAFEVHESTPHTRNFLVRREPMLRGVRVEFLTAINAKFPGGGTGDAGPEHR